MQCSVACDIFVNQITSFFYWLNIREKPLFQAAWSNQHSMGKYDSTLIRLSSTSMKQWGIIKRSRKYHGLHNAIICFFPAFWISSGFLQFLFLFPILSLLQIGASFSHWTGIIEQCFLPPQWGWHKDCRCIPATQNSRVFYKTGKVGYFWPLQGMGTIRMSLLSICWELTLLACNCSAPTATIN